METSDILAWTLVSECPIPQDVQNLLVQGEQAVGAYKTFRDTAIFTNMRLIVRDAQGMTGKKVEIYSLPYSRIDMWSSENAGTLDWNSELVACCLGTFTVDAVQDVVGCFGPDEGVFALVPSGNEGSDLGDQVGH